MASNHSGRCKLLLEFTSESELREWVALNTDLPLEAVAVADMQEPGQPSEPLFVLTASKKEN